MTRQTGIAAALEAELDTIANRRAALAEQVFGTLYPGADGRATLMLLPARGGYAHAAWLADTYVHWARRRGGEVQVQAAVPVDDGAGKPGSAGPKRKQVFRFREWKPTPSPDATPVALRVAVAGFPGAVLLAAEHGQHRFTSAGITHVVRVHFEAGRRRAEGRAFDATEWEKTSPSAEIRRVSIDKKQVRDLRLEVVYGLPDGDLDLEPVVLDYLAFRVLGRVGQARWRA